MLKVCFIHPWVDDVPSLLKYVRMENLADPAGLVWDENAPDVLFASEFIHYRKECFDKFRRLYPRSGLKVAYFGEALEPDWNVFDYAVGFSDRYAADPRYVRLLSPCDMFTSFIPATENELSDASSAIRMLPSKPGFCNFLYSNPDAHPMRDRLFHCLSAYRRVDSLGRHLNNMAVPGTGWSGHAAECTGIKSAYKFSIASENACFNGYTSEKVFTSFAAHTVPVYWGNPDIGDDVNPEAIVNVACFESLDAVLERVRQIDSDDSLWAEIVSRPWRTPAQVAAHQARTDAYLAGMTSFLTGNCVPTAPEGYHVNLYRSHTISGQWPMDAGLLSRIKNKFNVR